MDDPNEPVELSLRRAQETVEETLETLESIEPGVELSEPIQFQPSAVPSTRARVAGEAN